MCMSADGRKDRSLGKTRRVNWGIGEGVVDGSGEAQETV